jgi:hypothetical protein
VVAEIHSNKALRKQVRRSELVRSWSSKLRAFNSLQIHHNKNERITFRMIMMPFRPTLLFQHAKRSTTPNIWKTIIQSDLAFFHYFYIYNTNLSLWYDACRLSKVRIFPREAVQVKKANLEGVLDLQMLFQGKGESTLRRRTLLKIWPQKIFFFRASTIVYHHPSYLL